MWFSQGDHTCGRLTRTSVCGTPLPRRPTALRVRQQGYIHRGEAVGHARTIFRGDTQVGEQKLSIALGKRVSAD
jgi:hypothetical protein